MSGAPIAYAFPAMRSTLGKNHARVFAAALADGADGAALDRLADIATRALMRRHESQSESERESMNCYLDAESIEEARRAAARLERGQ